jgi:hypothetical protein
VDAVGRDHDRTRREPDTPGVEIRTDQIEPGAGGQLGHQLGRESHGRAAGGHERPDPARTEVPVGHDAAGRYGRNHRAGHLLNRALRDQLRGPVGAAHVPRADTVPHRQVIGRHQHRDRWAPG